MPAFELRPVAQSLRVEGVTCGMGLAAAGFVTTSVSPWRAASAAWEGSVGQRRELFAQLLNGHLVAAADAVDAGGPGVGRPGR